MSAYMVVAEDDHKQAELIRRYLEHDGHWVVVAEDGPSALRQARERRPDLLVLDVMLPGMNGLDVCRELRSSGQADVPVLILTALDTEDDLLRGLDSGADDYLSKPYSPRELVARVRSLLRRSAVRLAASAEVLRVGHLSVDLLRHEVNVNGCEIPCTPAEFDLLAMMAAQPGRVFDRRQIMERLFGLDAHSTSRAVDGHVMNLRRKIERDPAQPEFLVTVYGVGYKLTAPKVPRADI